MKYSRVILATILTLPLLTIPFLDRNTVKRFLPASFIMSLIVQAEAVFAKKRRWWWVYEKLFPKMMGITPLIWSPFLLGTIWLLKLTYGKFLLYISSNIVIHSIFVYPFINWMQKLGLGSLVRLPRINLFILFFLKSIFLYGIQYTLEKFKKVNNYTY